MTDSTFSPSRALASASCASLLRAAVSAAALFAAANAHGAEPSPHVETGPRLAASTPVSGSADPRDAGSSAPIDEPKGLAVLAAAGAENDAWGLARAIYADASLRPHLDEAHARVLAGEPAPATASTELHDLADTRAAVKGDDAASKRLLSSIAAQLHVRGIVFVTAGPPAIARVFVTSLSAFDAASYTASYPANATIASPPSTASDGGAPPASNAVWTDTVRLLARSYAPTPVPSTAMLATSPSLALATNAVPPEKPSDAPTHRPFYTSPWFWGAIGAAAFGGVALYFATRDSDSGTIHLQLQVPK